MYPSLKYLALGNIILFSGMLFFNNYKGRKKSLIFLLPVITFFIIQIPFFSQWFGKEGIVRLQQESGKRMEEISLSVNHFRQSCWISSDHNPITTKACYALWNKPLNRLDSIIKTSLETVGVTQLFVRNVDPYIIPIEYGAYAWSLSIPFFIGLHALFRTHSFSSIILIAISITSIGITSMVGQSSVHRNLTFYYLAFLIIGGGIHYFYNLKTSFYKHRHYVILGVLALTSFLNLRYLINYFFVYRASQPTVSAYNIKPVSQYLQTIEDNYDAIYDDHYFVGPLLYAFSTKIDPYVYQQSAIWSEPNQYGNTIPVKLGKYETKHLNLDKIACADFTGLWITKTQQELPSEYALINFMDGLGKSDVSIYDLEFLSNQLECSE